MGEGQLEEIKRELGALRRETAERFDEVGQRFDKADQRFDEVDQRFERIDQRFDEADQRFERIDHRFDKADLRFGSIDEQFRATHVLIEDLHSKVQTVAEGVVSMNDKLDRHREETSAQISEVLSLLRLSHSGLDSRVTRLEERTERCESRLDDLEATG